MVSVTCPRDRAKSTRTVFPTISVMSLRTCFLKPGYETEISNSPMGRGWNPIVAGPVRDRRKRFIGGDFFDGDLRSSKSCAAAVVNGSNQGGTRKLRIQPRWNRKHDQHRKQPLHRYLASLTHDLQIGGASCR